MTIREHFNTRKKRVLTALLACALLAVASAFVSVRYEAVFLLTLACVLTAIVVMYLAVILGFRCPRCRGQWGYLAMYSGGVFSIRKDLRFCPYCGVEIDQALGVDSLQPHPGSMRPDE
ncbi:MAG: hypothetical protein MUF10_00790 [Thermoanaerobaculaceae bacterium]|jgi:hypothetical protein|nr:hypothetical protein [Thermoanaerobaculaceae bacterium]